MDEKISQKIKNLEKTNLELIRKEESLRIIFEKAPVGIGHIDSLTLKFIEVNQNMCDIFGYSREELFKKKKNRLNPPDFF